jgi:hypothetical protein
MDTMKTSAEQSVICSGLPTVTLGAWGTLVQQDLDMRDKYFLELPQHAWEDLARRHLQQAKNVRAAMRWLDMIDSRRHTYIKPTFHDPIKQCEYSDLALYKDLIDEAGKYGTDADELLPELDAAIMATPKAWRLNAYKIELKDKEELPGKIAAVVKIQAAWRGYIIRDQWEYMSCAWCLCHGVSAYRIPDSYVVRYHPTMTSYNAFLCKDCCDAGLRSLEIDGCFPHESFPH